MSLRGDGTTASTTSSAASPSTRSIRSTRSLGSSSLGDAAAGTAAGQGGRVEVAGSTSRCIHADGTRCAFGGVYQPSIAGARFFAMSYFPNVWEFLSLPIYPDKSADLTAVVAEGSKVCTLDWAKLQAYNADLPAPGPPQVRPTFLLLDSPSAS